MSEQTNSRTNQHSFLESTLKQQLREKHAWVGSYTEFSTKQVRRLLDQKKKMEKQLLDINRESKEQMEASVYLQEKLDFHVTAGLDTEEVLGELDVNEASSFACRVVMSVLTQIIGSIARLIAFGDGVYVDEVNTYNSLLKVYKEKKDEEPSVRTNAYILSHLVNIFETRYNDKNLVHLVNYAHTYTQLHQALKYLCVKGWKFDPSLNSLKFQQKMQEGTTKEYDLGMAAPLEIDFNPEDFVGLDAGVWDTLDFPNVHGEKAHANDNTLVAPVAITAADDDGTYWENVLNARVDEGLEDVGIPQNAADLVAESVAGFDSVACSSEDSNYSYNGNIKIEPGTVNTDVMVDLMDEDKDHVETMLFWGNHVYNGLAKFSKKHFHEAADFSSTLALLLFRPIGTFGTFLEVWTSVCEQVPSTGEAGERLQNMQAKFKHAYEAIEAELQQEEVEGKGYDSDKEQFFDASDDEEGKIEFYQDDYEMNYIDLPHVMETDIQEEDSMPYPPPPPPPSLPSCFLPTEETKTSCVDVKRYDYPLEECAHHIPAYKTNNTHYIAGLSGAYLSEKPIVRCSLCSNGTNSYLSFDPRSVHNNNNSKNTVKAELQELLHQQGEELETRLQSLWSGMERRKQYQQRLENYTDTPLLKEYTDTKKDIVTSSSGTKDKWWEPKLNELSPFVVSNSHNHNKDHHSKKDNTKEEYRPYSAQDISTSILDDTTPDLTEESTFDSSFNIQHANVYHSPSVSKRRSSLNSNSNTKSSVVGSPLYSDELAQYHRFLALREKEEIGKPAATVPSASKKHASSNPALVNSKYIVSEKKCCGKCKTTGPLVEAVVADVDKYTNSKRAQRQKEEKQSKKAEEQRIEQFLDQMSVQSRVSVTSKPVLVDNVDIVIKRKPTKTRRQSTPWGVSTTSISHGSDMYNSAAYHHSTFPCTSPIPVVVSSTPAPVVIQVQAKERKGDIFRLPRSLHMAGANKGVCAPPQSLPVRWDMHIISTTNHTGCMVTNSGNGLAAIVGIVPGDKVVYVNNRYTRDTKEWTWACQMAHQDVVEQVTDKLSLQIERNGVRYVIYVPIRNEEEE